MEMNTSDDVFEAIQTGNSEQVAELVRKTPDLLQARNSAGLSPVLFAAYHQQEAVLNELLRHAPVLDIFEAASVGQTERIAELVGDRPESADRYSGDGFTALGLAAFFGRRETLEYLVSTGTDVNAGSRNVMQVRPLHSAVACRQPDVGLSMAETLLSHGADPNVKQQGGWTPLHQAAAHGHIEMVNLLLRHGADVDSMTDDGATPLDMAIEKGRPEVARILRSRGSVE